MDQFLQTIASFPTVVFTGLLGASFLYWGLVMVGAVDADSGDGLDVDGGDADIGADGDGDIDGDADGSSALAGILSALHLTNAPLTVTLSILSLIGWVASYFGSTLVPEDGGMKWAVGIGVMLAALALAIPATSLITRPMRSLFVTHRAPKNQSFTGKVCRVRGAMDANSGQAELADGGAGLILNIRCADGELTPGSDALIIGYDEEANVFEVELMDELLAERHK